MENEFQAYESGYRLGIFHKCNGIDMLCEWEYVENSVNEAFFDGYYETYENNERRI